MKQEHRKKKNITFDAGLAQKTYDGTANIKYDKVEEFDNGVESGFKRNHGILELWVSVCRRWYNGHIMYRPHLKIQGCGRDDDGYPTRSTVETLEEKVRTRVERPRKTKQINRSCGCRKGL